MAIRQIPGFDAQGNPLVRVVDDANMLATLTKARNAIATNKTYIALASPSVAQTNAEVKALAQQVNALILFLGGDFSDVSGT